MPLRLRPPPPTTTLASTSADRFSANDVPCRSRIATATCTGRYHLSARLCRIWNECQANERFREIACRDLLRRLQGRGPIELPPPLQAARRPGCRNVGRAPAALPPITVEPPAFTGAANSRTS